jgi:hypothetical protein
MLVTKDLTNQQLRELITSNKKNGDTERCATIYEHNYNYLCQVIMGHRENQAMLEDMVTTISNRQEMEKAMIARRAKKHV